MLRTLISWSIGCVFLAQFVLSWMRPPYEQPYDLLAWGLVALLLTRLASAGFAWVLCQAVVLYFRLAQAPRR